MAKTLMLQGTASGVGKTILTLGLCRIFKQDGFSVSPFKSQNITSNTTIIDNGDEIASSQWLQAIASGIKPQAVMNPVILKPGTEVILNGKYFDKVNLYNFKEMKKKLLPEITASYNSLSSKYDIVLIEGAGSPVELNLNKNDIVNMGIAKLAKAPVFLVADIDRGGIFASLYGTVMLLEESERAFIKGIIVNRFRGDLNLFADGIKILEEITNIPVLGVVPYININLPEEDSIISEVNLENIADYEKEIDKIADIIRQSLDMEKIYEILR